MGTRLRMISKEEAHKLIDKAPGNSIMILTYDSNFGMSDTGKYVKKKSISGHSQYSCISRK